MEEKVRIQYLFYNVLFLQAKLLRERTSDGRMHTNDFEPFQSGKI